MKIKINNYKNIAKLEFKIEKNKINTLFGISGSGKTSIAQALMNVDFAENLTIGKDLNTNNIVVKINNKECNFENFRLYDIYTQEKLLLEVDKKQDIYSIIFDDESKISTLQKEISQYIIQLIKYDKNIDSFIMEMKTVNSKIAKLKKDDSFSSSSKIIKLEEDFKNLKNSPNTISLITESNLNLIKWKIDGTTISEDYENKKCPFCLSELKNETIEIMNNIKQITPENFYLIEKSGVNFDTIGIKKPDNLLTDLEDFKEDLKKSIKLYDYLMIVKKFLSNVNDPSFSPSDIEKICEFKGDFLHFEELNKIIKNINDRIEDIKKIKGDLINEFNKIKSKNIDKINKYIKNLGIPYKIKISEQNTIDKTANFILYHVDDNEQKNKVRALSFGERNILSLIMFLLVKDNKFLIIDDPVSSYDDYRRKIILDMIYEFSGDRTCLILSHDFVFLKYALFYYNKAERKNKKNIQLSNLETNYLNKTGILSFFENFNYSPKLIKISADDFNVMYEHVKKHLIDIENSCVYRKVLNLRLLAEIKNYEDDPDFCVVYKFLSALLHKEELINVKKLLKNEGKELEEVVNIVKNRFNCNLENIDEDYYKNFSINEFTDFEKALYYREETKDKNIRSQLDNLFHFNDSLLITINPYKFNFFSKNIFDIIHKRN